MISASSSVAGFQEDTRLHEALDLVGDHRGLAFGDALEHVAVRNEGEALLPGAVAGREVLLDVVVGPNIMAHAR